MMRRLPLILCNVAIRLLPDSRRSWADGMIAELSYADDDQAALSFARGCLLTALRERACDADTQIMASLWTIAVATALYAVIRLVCAAHGVAVLFGAHDGIRDALLRQGASSNVIASYEAARPIVVGCFLVLGTVQLATAWFLSRGQIRAFATAWCIALAIAGIAVAIQLSIIPDGTGVPSEFHALLMQAVAVPALLTGLHRLQRHFQER
jgi:hypothetical protein